MLSETGSGRTGRFGEALSDAKAKEEVLCGVMGAAAVRMRRKARIIPMRPALSFCCMTDQPCDSVEVELRASARLYSLYM